MRKLFFLIFLLFFSCKNEDKPKQKTNETNEILTIENNPQLLKVEILDTVDKNLTTEKKDIEKTVSIEKDTIKPQKKEIDFQQEFINLKELSNDFVYDIKYATTDNFLKQAVYDCPECFLRKETALALIKANMAFKEKGYTILIYDCYRPLDVQKKNVGNYARHTLCC